jgi:hypothetical protein
MTARLSLDPPVASAGSWPERKPPSIAVQDAEPTPSDSTMAGRTGGAHPPTAAYDETRAAIRAQAARTRLATIKARARDYLAEPWQLDMLGARPGFIASAFTPDQLIEFAKKLLRQDLEFCERMAPRRVELVPVKMWNAKAAILSGRYRRAKANQSARAA